MSRMIRYARPAVVLLAIAVGACNSSDTTSTTTSTLASPSLAAAVDHFTGTLTQNDTIAFTQAGNPCLQTAGTGYCTNGAGVLTVAATVGVTPVGGSSSFAGPSGVIPAGTWTPVPGHPDQWLFHGTIGEGLIITTSPDCKTLSWSNGGIWTKTH